MRGLGRFAAAPTKHSLLAASSSSSCSHAFSTFSGGGGGGRGRGRGLGPPFQSPPSSVPGKPQGENDADDPIVPSGLGHGRGRVAQPPLPSSAILPSFSAFMSSVDTPAASARFGRGRGRQISPSAPPPPPEQTDPSQPKKPIFFRLEDGSPGKTPIEFAGENAAPPPRPLNLTFGIPVAGRGKEKKPVDTGSKPPEDNRHLRQRPVEAAPGRGGGRSPPRRGRGGPGGRGVGLQPAESGRGRGFTGERGGRGRGGGGREVYARGGRGGRFGRLRPRDDSDSKGLYLGDNADGEKLAKRLGEEGAKELQEALDEVSYNVLPCPQEEAFNDAFNMNCRIEFEPEYLVEFNNNPDIDEKPPIPLRDALQKMKPFLMEYEGIQSEEEWEEIMKDVMERAPYLKKIVDKYSGPDIVTAKQQQQELERVAKTLPENIPASVKRFTDHALLSLQSNPGWGFDKKWKFMDKLALQVSRHYK